MARRTVGIRDGSISARSGAAICGKGLRFVRDGRALSSGSRAYVELNPVRAKLASKAEEWPWSSARAHLSGRDDKLTNVSPLLAIVADWRGFLDSALREEELRDLRNKGVGSLCS